VTTYTAAQIAQVAARAGWSGSALTTAVAVALAESSGRIDVVNSIGCVGLWQINVPVHPQWTTAAMKDPNANASAAHSLYVSAGNKWTPWEAYTTGAYLAQMGRAQLATASMGGSAGQASQVSSGGSGGAATVDPAAYNAIGGQAGLLDSIPGLGALIDPFNITGDGGAGDLFGPLASIGKAVLALSVLGVRASAWTAQPKNWLRIVEVMGGAAALFIGLKMLADSGVGGPVAGVVRGGVHVAAKGAKAAKKVTGAATQAGAAVATGGTSAVAKTAAATAAKGVK
jgi:hypothetical protein